MDLRHSKATLISLGAVDTTGVPALNQVARFFDADTVQGSVNFTFTGSLLTLTGTQTIIANSASALRVRTPGGEFTTHFEVDTTGTAIIKLSSGAELRWGSDLKLFRDGAWQLALRDGTNANFFYVYGTFTDSNNYERLALYAGSSVTHFLESQAAGTGDPNINLIVRAAGLGQLTLGRATNANIRQIARTVTQEMPNTVTSNTTSETTTVTLSSGQSVTASDLIPANCLLLAVVTRVNTPITGPTGFDIGDGVDVDRWGASRGVSSGSPSGIFAYTSTALTYFPASNDVVITSDGVDFTGGVVRITVIYMQFGSPIS